MIDRPILFSGPMVLEALADRKRQTRRVVKPQPRTAHPGVYADRYNHGPEWAFWLPDNRMTEPRTWRCPYGTPGDGRLWVREAWRPVLDGWRSFIEYAAIGAAPYDARVITGRVFEFSRMALRFSGANLERHSEAWHPSIHMPKWASRLALEVVDVRVERLQEITEEDAIAEGMEAVMRERGAASPLEAFRLGWDVINGRRPGCRWEDSPWVWVITFRRPP